ncbi:MAG: hypothetical protein LUC88_10855 [Prevotella sp.]|nr:hypothetical protein [Prevotella sp.]
MQFTIVIIILTFALLYVAYSLYKSFTQNKGDRCFGCPLKEACDKKKMENSCPPDKR